MTHLKHKQKDLPLFSEGGEVKYNGQSYTFVSLRKLISLALGLIFLSVTEKIFD